MSKPRKNSELKPGCIVLFGLPFFAAGLFSTWLYFSSIAGWWSARSWVETPCQVSSVELERHSGENTTYRIKATYHYVYRNSEYTSESVNSSTGSDNIGSYHQDKLRELRPFARKALNDGKTVGERRSPPPYRCFVNPDDPSEAVLDRSLRWPMLLFYSAFALTFPAFGFFLVFSPLLFKKDDPPSSETSIPEHRSPANRCILIYTVWAALVIGPMLLTVQAAGAFREDKLSLLLLLFPLAWLIPAGFLIRIFRRRSLVGKTFLSLDTAPTLTGSVLEGAVVCEKFPTLTRDPEITLSCTRQKTVRSGKNTSTTEEELWTHTEIFPSLRITREIGSCRIPVHITLPHDAPPSGSDGPTEHTWKLRLKVPGTPVSSAYIIPVSRNPAPSPAVGSTMEGTSSGIAAEAEKNLPSLLGKQKLTAGFLPSGDLKSITAAPSRHLRTTLFLTLFNIVWTFITIVLFEQNAPLLFKFTWSASSAFIWLLIIHHLLHTRSFALEGDQLRITNSYRLFRREKVVPRSEIRRFAVREHYTSNQTVFQKVLLTEKSGVQTKIVGSIAGKSTGEAIVAHLDRWLGDNSLAPIKIPPSG